MHFLTPTPVGCVRPPSGSCPTYITISSLLWGWTGGSPTHASLPPYHHFPPPRPPLPSPSSPTSVPLEYFSRPHRKKQKKKKKKKKQQVISSYNLSFQCMDYYQSFKTVGQFVCLFLRSFVSLFFSFTT